jgi:nucleoside-diphosphate-sugar epimerase
MILVTGATGFIGSNLMRFLAAKGHPVVGADCKAAEDISDLPDNVAIETVDLARKDATEALVRKYRPKTIIALAEAFEGPIRNLVEESASRHGMLLDVAAEASVSRVCFASSIVVYMGLQGPFREDATLPVESLLHVAAVKKVGEQINHWHDSHGDMEIVNMRLANIYGPRYHSMMNYPSRALFSALGRNLPATLPNVPPHIYRMAQDYCYIDDSCEAIRLLVEAEQLAHRCYNIGGGSGVCEAEVQAAVNEVTGANEPFELPTEPIVNYMDISRIADELGYRPQQAIGAGIARYRDWLRDNAR